MYRRRAYKSAGLDKQTQSSLSHGAAHVFKGGGGMAIQWGVSLSVVCAVIRWQRGAKGTGGLETLLLLHPSLLSLPHDLLVMPRDRYQRYDHNGLFWGAWGHACVL